MKTRKIRIDNYVWIDTDQIKEGSVLEFKKTPRSRVAVRAFEKIAFGEWEEITNKDYSYSIGDDRHLGCPSYPDCDEAPYGCSVRMGDKVEWIGHRD